MAKGLKAIKDQYFSFFEQMEQGYADKKIIKAILRRLCYNELMEGRTDRLDGKNSDLDLFPHNFVIEWWKFFDIVQPFMTCTIVIQGMEIPKSALKFS